MNLKGIVLSLLAVSSAGFVPNNRVAFVDRVTRLYGDEVDMITLDAEDRMDKSIENVKMNLSTIRTGRASPVMLDRVKCDYYGVMTPLSQMARISVPSAQQLVVEPFDKSTLGDVERAIIDADLGLNPQNDGTIIRLNIPALTEDRRKEMMKRCQALGEEGKVALRNIRRDGSDKIKKLESSGEIGQDEMRGGLDDMDKLTSKQVDEISKLVSSKEKEVMTV